jgi:hypothetical protein
MHRSAPLILSGALALVAAATLAAQAPSEEDNRKINTLAVQQAMATARQHLREHQPKKAVDLLEGQLNRAGGNPGYLDLLRDAYCDFIRQMFLENQAAVAQRYLQRLSILDPTEAGKLAAPANPAPVKFAAPEKRKVEMPLPNFAAAQALPHAQPASPGAPQPPRIIASAGVAEDLKPTARGKIEDPAADPFDPSNEHKPAGMDPRHATKLLALANQEFTQRRYKEARRYYEQACRADGRCADMCRDSFAYCMLSDVVEHLNQPNLGGKSIHDLQQDVQGAMTLAPRLQPTAQWLLSQINQRHTATPATASTAAAPGNLPEPPMAMHHYGRNPQGWHVTETPHFRIFHNQQRDLVERVAAVAERTRVEMQRKWFGSERSDWNDKCELVLHASAEEYSKFTGVPTASPGHSRIEHDPATQRVIGRRLDLHVDNPSMLEAVLPHEATHCVLAGQFGPYQVPRWADEGMAVLSEPREKVEQHRRNLLKAAQEGELFNLKELMLLDNYPKSRQVGVFYAQSVSLVEFLVQQRGPQTLAEFVRDGLREGYDAALRKHYGWDFGTLQQQWQAQALSGQRIAGN